jgi:predicted nucleotidyltransferase
MWVDKGLDVAEYLRMVYNAVMEILTSPNVLENSCSIVVFGSAARPEDFVLGVSDVDVLVLTKDPPKRRWYEFTVFNSTVNVTVFTINEFKRLIKLGDPLVFMLKYSVILHDKCSKTILRAKPKITKYTKYVLRRSVFAALGLALENYYILENYKRATSHLYHSVRHLARYKSLSKGELPISDREVYGCSRQQLKNLYLTLSNARRREIGRGELRNLISRVVKLVARELNLKATSLNSLENEIKEDTYIINAGESDSYIVFRVERYEDGRRKIIEIKDEEVREVNNVFF